MPQNANPHAEWPDLDRPTMPGTLRVLHMWTQIVGKVRLERTPWINHSWHVPLYVSPRGLRTSAIPGDGGIFELEFDFHDDRLTFADSGGHSDHVDLGPRSVADVYRDTMAMLERAGVPTAIRASPTEIPDGTPFEEDREAGAYDPEAARAFWDATVAAHRVFQEFRARFRGKSSPVHFFWGSFDLAVSRFSGRDAPEHPAGFPALPDWVAREAYDREVSSLGFWPGNADQPGGFFYSYLYPSAEGFSTRDVGPGATWSDELGEYLLPYGEVRGAADPRQALLDFAQATYVAAAEAADWDRGALEWPNGASGPPQLG